MQDRKYLLSIRELLTAQASESLWQRCLKWQDAERLGRIRRLEEAGNIHNGSKVAEHIGAGIILQLAVWEALGHAPNCVNGTGLIRLTLSDALLRLEKDGHEPISLEYTYGEIGKPYLKKYPYYFNLSHSGEFLFCVISEEEVGVDIQRMKALEDFRIAKRFFGGTELQYLEESRSHKDKQERFYRLWTCKEAYGKLTGRGITASISRAVCGVEGFATGQDLKTQGPDAGEYIIEEFTTEDYQLAICKWK